MAGRVYPCIEEPWEYPGPWYPKRACQREVRHPDPLRWPRPLLPEEPGLGGGRARWRRGCRGVTVWKILENLPGTQEFG